MGRVSKGKLENNQQIVFKRKSFFNHNSKIERKKTPHIEPS